MTGRKWLLYFAAGSVLTGEAFAGKNSERKNEKDKTPPQESSFNPPPDIFHQVKKVPRDLLRTVYTSEQRC